MNRRAVILTSYLQQPPRGKRLGAPGYSYDIVARLFLPLLERWGEVVPVPRDPGCIESAIRDARQRGLQPLQLSFLPFQDVYLTPSAPNVVFPFWEFPDVPAEAFDGNPRNNWVATANRCDLVLVGGQFTVEAFERAGIRTAIRVVPVPTPNAYFHLPRWSGESVTRIACPAYVFPHPQVPTHELWDAPDAEQHDENRPARPSLKRALLGQLRGIYRRLMKPLIPPILHEAMRHRARPIGHDPWRSYLWNCRREELQLSGIVYTSIFSPHDGRKNWQDLLSGFVLALRDRPDATLIVKLIAKDRLTVEKVLNYYRTLGLGHRCQVVFITEYLSAEQMLESGAGKRLLPDDHARGGLLSAAIEFPRRGPARSHAVPHGHRRLFRSGNGVCHPQLPGANHLATRPPYSLQDDVASPGVALGGRADPRQLRTGAQRSRRLRGAVRDRADADEGVG